MQNITIFLFSILLLFTLTSCEKVIELDLAEAEPNIVIEAVLPAGDAGLKVTITKSSSYYTADLPTPVENATVILTDEAGNNYTAEYIENGRYAAALIAEINTTYTLEVEVENERYVAESFLPAPAKLLTIEAEYQEALGPVEEGYSVFFRYQDEPNVENYYRVLHYIDGVPQLEGSDLQILNDSRNDGLQPRLPIFQHTFAEGENITVELIHFDRAVHDYFSALTDIISAGGPGGGTAAPGNPPTNWSNGALGYFSAFSTDRLEVVAEE